MHVLFYPCVYTFFTFGDQGSLLVLINGSLALSCLAVCPLSHGLNNFSQNHLSPADNSLDLNALVEKKMHFAQNGSVHL